MQNPVELTVLYRKDTIPEYQTARQCTVNDFDAYELLVDLAAVSSIETSLVDEARVSILTMCSGACFSILMPYRKLKALVLGKKEAFDNLFEKVPKN